MGGSTAWARVSHLLRRLKGLLGSATYQRTHIAGKFTTMTQRIEDEDSGPDRRDFLASTVATVVLSASGAVAAHTQDRSGFDVIVVGGGSTGAVLANRRSADPSRRVLLIEAGKAYPPNAYPDVVKRQELLGGDPAHDWGFQSEPGLLGRRIPLNRGKVLSGSSAINGAVAMRLPKSDHDRWAREHDLGPFSWKATRVRGVSGLRVVDASIWPDVPSVATGFPTMMLAESIAATMANFARLRSNQLLNPPAQEWEQS